VVAGQVVQRVGAIRQHALGNHLAAGMIVLLNRTAQRNHITLALRAFLRLECHRLQTSVSWFEAKRQIVRDAIRAYLANPSYQLSSTA